MNDPILHFFKILILICITIIQKIAILHYITLHELNDGLDKFKFKGKGKK